MTNLAHEGMDDMSDYAEANPWIKRRESHRALPLSPDWPTRRAFVPQGCDQQGRLEPTIKSKWELLDAQPYIPDRLIEAHDEEDQTDSADRDVTLFVLKFITAIVSACFLAWVGGAL